tara:strand:+ start:59 stop:409 length:351 start_codon:yes stop_codon:yes gene_type:complete
MRSPSRHAEPIIATGSENHANCALRNHTDPQEDPDYDSAGWGTESASVSYTQLIPVLVKSNQELHERIVVLESAQVTYDAQITDLESANDAKQHRIDELEKHVNALVARMEAVENA